MPARVCPFLIEIATTVFWGSVMNPFGSHYFVIRFHEMNTPNHALYLLLRSQVLAGLLEATREKDVATLACRSVDMPSAKCDFQSDL